MSFETDVASRIKDLRKEKGLSQTEFAQALNTTQDNISRIESAKKSIDIHTLCDIAKYFEVSTDYLFGIGEPTNKPDEIFICNYTGLSLNALQGIVKTMHKAVDFDNIFIDNHLEFEEAQILFDKNIIDKDKFDIICSEFTQSSVALTEKNIYNKLFSLSPNQIRVITSLRNVITAKLKKNIVLRQLENELTIANDFFVCELTEIENKANTQKDDYFKNNALLSLADTLKDDYSYRKWQLSEELNKFSETIIKEVLGENNADD